MLYQLTKPLAKIALSVYFRKIYFSNADRIPKEKPVILAANHPTAFIEPCIMACWLDEPLHFLARGDFALKSRLLKKLYEAYHMFPIFRIQDAGYGKLRANYEAFEICHELLKQNKTILILVEGGTEHEKRLREIKKGAARIAFGAWNKYPDLDIHMVPAGVNYSNSNRFRSDAMIDFGEAIRLKDYEDTWKENPFHATQLLTEDLKKVLSERVIHIERKEDETLVENLLEWHRSEKKGWTYPVARNDPSALYEEKAIADKVNTMSGADKKALLKSINVYKKELKRLNVSQLGLVNANAFNIKSALLIIIGFLPFLAGCLLNFFPLFLAGFVSKYMGLHVTFRASVGIAFGLVFYILYFFILMILAILFKNPFLIIGTIVMPSLGYFALTYTKFLKKWNAASRVYFLRKNDVEKLRSLRDNCRLKKQ